MHHISHRWKLAHKLQCSHIRNGPQVRGNSTILVLPHPLNGEAPRYDQKQIHSLFDGQECSSTVMEHEQDVCSASF